MEKWQKIEEFINRLLGQLAAVLNALVLKCTPKKVLQKVSQGQKAIKEKRSKVKETLKNSKSLPKELSNLILHRLMDIIEKLKEVSAKISVKLKGFKKGEALMLVLAFFTPLLYKIKSWWLSLRPEQIVIGILGSAVFGLTTLGIVTSTSQIAQKQAPAREPASKVENATERSVRPHYYKLDEKRAKIMNVQVPIYVGGSNDLRTVLVDFTFISSNQYIRTFILDEEHAVHDRLNTMIEPIMPEFFLEEEGKRILKEKIQYELNELLKSRGVKGKVIEVHIDSLLAG